jgi:hypothetical protein
MIRIAITVEAFDAITEGLRFGSFCQARPLKTADCLANCARPVPNRARRPARHPVPS